jgi:purine-nucleoside phosphorylase
LNIRKFTAKGLIMTYTLTDVKTCAAYLMSEGIEKPVTGIVLGTGLSTLINKMDVKISMPYNEIPGFPEATVEFHKGTLLYGNINNVSVLVMQGRFHYYEGYSMQQVTFPVRVMKELGIEYLLLSNAAGGMNPGYKKGDLVLITDHINEQPENPLRGLNDPAFGNRFVDMCSPYDEALNKKIITAAQKTAIKINQGIYVAVAGPNLETRAEYRLLRAMGADMVGMSTVPEVIVANHVGLPCAAISVITDECDPDNLQPVNIAEIIAVAGKADEKLSDLFVEVIGELGNINNRT